MTLTQPYGKNPGRIIGGVTLGETGPLSAPGSYAFYFDGSTGYVDTSNRQTNPPEYLVGFWVKCSTLTGVITNFHNVPFSAPNATTSGHIVYGSNGSYYDFGVNQNASNAVAGIFAPPVGWTFLVTGYNNTSETMLWSMNGEAYINHTPTGSTLNYQSWLSFGAGFPGGWYQNNGLHYFEGYLSEVTLWEGASTFPTNEQVSAIYSAASSSDPNAYPNAIMATKPSSYWRLHETSGIYAHDSVLPS